MCHIYTVFLFYIGIHISYYGRKCMKVEKGAALTLEDIKTLLIKMTFRPLSRPSSDIKNSSTKQCFKHSCNQQQSLCQLGEWLPNKFEKKKGKERKNRESVKHAMINFLIETSGK